MASTPARARAGRRVAVPLLACALVVTGCSGDAAPAESPTSAPSAAPSSSSGPEQPAPSGEPVLRVEVVGGFTTAAAASARTPVVSVYEDGRVVSVAPATDPAADGGAPPALPALVQSDVGADGVAALVDLAREAGVGSAADLGDPRLADATTVRFTLRADGSEEVTDAYALREAGTAPGPREDPGLDGAAGGEDVLGDLGALGPGALERRQRLADLLAALEDVGATLGEGAGEPVQYTPTVLAVLAAPARGGSDGPLLAWPGPDLDGEALGSTDVTCTAVFGDALAPVLDAAGAATTGAAWSWQGGEWDLSFRPLLPDETGCETVTEPATTPTP